MISEACTSCQPRDFETVSFCWEEEPPLLTTSGNIDPTQVLVRGALRPLQTRTAPGISNRQARSFSITYSTYGITSRVAQSCHVHNQPPDDVGRYTEFNQCVSARIKKIIGR
ncbi:hypothetical protein CEXT_64741 [Caerostris extrusa]|uniref:Uncharacterized protein n=1 Tax=Caerostris extrusa TaxID=172846 RepID=A0AAV4RK63_CAEEX|nr:hypothetical protein CEXT_64741 [Caerostris extrusa]